MRARRGTAHLPREVFFFGLGLTAPLPGSVACFFLAGTSTSIRVTSQFVGSVTRRLESELDSRSTEAGSQLGLTADAMRRTGDRLREEGNEAPAKIVTAVAGRAERLGDYMTHTNADRLVRDVESFARRQPLLFAFGGATLGFLASRFVKASGDRRYEGGDGHGSFRPATQSAPGTNGEAAKVNRELGNGRSAGQDGGNPCAVPAVVPVAETGVELRP